MAARLFIGNLPYSTSSQDLNDLFAQVGTVVSADVLMDRMTGRSRGFGFVEMESDADAQAAIERFNGYELDGRKLVVNIARPREERAPREDRGPREERTVFQSDEASEEGESQE